MNEYEDLFRKFGITTERYNRLPAYVKRMLGKLLRDRKELQGELEALRTNPPSQFSYRGSFAGDVLGKEVFLPAGRYRGIAVYPWADGDQPYEFGGRPYVDVNANDGVIKLRGSHPIQVRPEASNSISILMLRRFS